MKYQSEGNSGGASRWAKKQGASRTIGKFFFDCRKIFFGCFWIFLRQQTEFLQNFEENSIKLWEFCHVFCENFSYAERFQQASVIYSGFKNFFKSLTIFFELRTFQGTFRFKTFFSDPWNFIGLFRKKFKNLKKCFKAKKKFSELGKIFFLLLKM